MRRAIPAIGALALLAAAGAVANGQNTATSNPAGARVLGTHQIDRYAAIQQVRAALQANPNNLNDWIILGELAQEVAGDVPADMAAGYYKLAHDAYESASKLSPNNASLKAAAAFTQEQEQKAEQYAQARRRAVGTYLETRRRELSQPGASATVRVYSPTAAPAPYYYQPYSGNDGQAYTYQQHSGADTHPTDDGIPAQPRSGQVMTATERAALVKPAAKFAPP